jgi:steroid delta-isomerase-like uncharacterized protein
MAMDDDDTRERNRQLVSRYFAEVLSRGRLETIDELMRSDLVFHISTIPDGVRGIDAYKDFVRTLRTAFPDGVFALERMIATETRAAARWTFKGTHRGPFLGVAPTGRTITDQGIDVFHLADGRITDIWANEDAFGLMKQLGSIPADVAS